MTERKMPRWGPEDRPSKVPEAAFRSYEGKAVVVVPSGAEINVLNPEGSLVFELLDGSHTVAEIVEEVRKQYEVPEGEARDDLMEFLTDLEAHGMLADAAGSKG